MPRIGPSARVQPPTSTDMCRGAFLSPTPDDPAVPLSAAITIVPCRTIRFPAGPTAYRHFEARAKEVQRPLDIEVTS